MDRPYLAIDLIDDNVSQNTRTSQVIGVYVIAGQVPRLVACGPDLPLGKRPEGPLCLSEVAVEGGADHPHRGHLTRTPLTTLSDEQLEALFDCGFFDFEQRGSYVELLGSRNRISGTRSRSSGPPSETAAVEVTAGPPPEAAAVEAAAGPPPGRRRAAAGGRRRRSPSEATAVEAASGPLPEAAAREERSRKRSAKSSETS